MTQEQALAAAQQLFPDIAEFITVSRERSIGFRHGSDNQYYLWDHTNHGSSILGSSEISWEQALDEAKAKNDANYTPENAPWEDDVEK